MLLLFFYVSIFFLLLIFFYVNLLFYILMLLALVLSILLMTVIFGVIASLDLGMVILISVVRQSTNCLSLSSVPEPSSMYVLLFSFHCCMYYPEVLPYSTYLQ